MLRVWAVRAALVLMRPQHRQGPAARGFVQCSLAHLAVPVRLMQIAQAQPPWPSPHPEAANSVPAPRSSGAGACAVAAMRRVVHEGQIPRPLQEKATK